MIDKTEAIKLREAGYTYKQISTELKISEDWCKKNLKGVGKNTNEVGVIKNLMIDANSNDGITSGDVKKAVVGLSPSLTNDEEQKMIRKFKTKVRADGGLIRPYWMQPSSPKLSFDLVLSAVNNMDERLFDEVNSIRQELNLDESYINSLSYAINSMTYAGSMNLRQPVGYVCERLMRVVEELQKRNKNND